jgi:FkbM family methyltransferase
MQGVSVVCVHRLRAQASRRLAIAREIWRDLPRYAQRRLLYRIRSGLDSSWQDTRQVVRLVGSGDLSMEVVPRDEIGRFLYLYGLWDLSGTRLMQANLRPGMTVLDVGANIGYFTLLAARSVGQEGLVHSFEPHDEIRGELERNVRRNGLRNVVVRPEAVARSTGEVAFYRSAEATNQGISSTIEGSTPLGQAREARPSIVPAVRLDDVSDSLGRSVDLVKIDVEGAERAALEGGESLFSAPDAPLVLLESFEIDVTAELLRTFGFTVRRLRFDWRRGLHLSPELAEEDEGEPNFVAYKERHASSLATLSILEQSATSC